MGNRIKGKSTAWCWLLAAMLVLAVAVCVPRTVQAAQVAPVAAAQTGETLPDEEGQAASEPEVVSVPQQETPLAQQPTSSSMASQGLTMVVIVLCAMALGTLIFFVRRRLPHKEEAEG